MAVIFCSGLCIHASCRCLNSVFSHSETPTCQRITDIWLWQNIFQIFLSYSGFSFSFCFFFFLVVVLSRDTQGCIPGSYVTWAGPWWTRFYYTSPVSHIASQSASLRRKKAEREWRHTARGRPNGRKTRIPCSQSQPTEPLKWCRISPEACRVELSEGGTKCCTLYSSCQLS